MEATNATASCKMPALESKPIVQLDSLENGSAGSLVKNADADLARLGYEPELKRHLGVVAVLGLSFSIIAAPFGLSVGFIYALINGGPTAILWGWVLVSFISVCIAASLGEICSCYPSSGGVYVWAAFIAPKRYSAIASWIVGWVSLAANLFLSLSILFGGAQLIMSAISTFRNQEWTPEPWQTILCFFACVLIAALVNLFGSKYQYLEMLNTISIYWGAATVVIILVTLLTMAPTKRSGAFVFGAFENRGGWPDGWAFLVGLLQAAYTLTGYGTVAQCSEETRNPAKEVPRAMVGSVIAASLSGLLYLLPILFVLPDIDTLLDTLHGVAAGQPITLLFYIVTGSPSGAFGLLFLLLGIFFFAGVGSLTVALRCIWAFARDGGIPGHKWASRVNKTFEMPVNALILSSIIIALLGIIFQGASAAFAAFTGAATILLSMSYAVPICISLFQRRRKVRNAPFSLGIWGWFANVVTFVWILLAIVLFSCPTTKEVDASTMNYASAVSAFFALISAVYYVIIGRKHYRGPLGVQVDDA
ncbi:amino acid transporter, partial [Tilletiaria anomala UBC 951]